MKIFLIAIPLFLLSVLSAYAANVDDIMNKAAQHYRNNDFASAINHYEKLVREGYSGVSLFYNLGNAYYRIGKLGYAILYYEKALKLSPNDEDVKHNLTLANLSTIDKIDTLPKFFLFEWWESFLSVFTTQTWIILSLVIYLLLLVVISVYFFASTIIHPRISFFTGAAVLVILIFSISLAAIKLNRENKRLEAIVVENSVVVKLSPDERGKDGFVVHAGLKILLEDEIDDWRKIRLPDGKVGWLPSGTIRQI